jgi:uncharacterized membrane protein
MRVVVRIAIVLSVITVVGTILATVKLADDLNSYGWDRTLDEQLSGGQVLFAVLLGALYSLVPLAFIWLGVFVVYCIARARQTPAS